MANIGEQPNREPHPHPEPIPAPPQNEADIPENDHDEQDEGQPPSPIWRREIRAEIGMLMPFSLAFCSNQMNSIFNALIFERMHSMSLNTALFLLMPRATFDAFINYSAMQYIRYRLPNNLPLTNLQHSLRTASYLATAGILIANVDQTHSNLQVIFPTSGTTETFLSYGIAGFMVGFHTFRYLAAFDILNFELSRALSRQNNRSLPLTALFTACLLTGAAIALNLTLESASDLPARLLAEYIALPILTSSALYLSARGMANESVDLYRANRGIQQGEPEFMVANQDEESSFFSCLQSMLRVSAAITTAMLAYMLTGNMQHAIFMAIAVFMSGSLPREIRTARNQHRFFAAPPAFEPMEIQLVGEEELEPAQPLLQGAAPGH